MGREKDFCLFSLSFPEESFAYNPLLNGTVESRLKPVLWTGLKFEEEYYKAQSSLFLGGIFYPLLSFLNLPVSFSLLDNYLQDNVDAESKL